MKISVIIPVFNDGGPLGECVASLQKQSIKNFEIVLVDDGSTDDTKEIIENIQSTSHNIKAYFQSHRGPAVARNLGSKHAYNQILVFLDADMTFNKFFLKNLTKPIISGKSKGTFSREEYVENWENVWSRCWNYNQNLKTQHLFSKSYPKKQKVFRAILKSEFIKAGGFSKGGYTDDYSLSEKLGYFATEAKNAKYYHKNPSSLKEVFFQSKWSAKRKYKLGFLGVLAALFRLSLPITKLSAVYKSIKYKTAYFYIFKFVYNTGATFGIFEYYIFGKNAK